MTVTVTHLKFAVPITLHRQVVSLARQHGLPRATVCAQLLDLGLSQYNAAIFQDQSAQRAHWSRLVSYLQEHSSPGRPVTYETLAHHLWPSEEFGKQQMKRIGQLVFRARDQLGVGVIRTVHGEGLYWVGQSSYQEAA